MRGHRRWVAIVGSVGQPRDRSPAAAYTLFDFTARYQYKWLEAFLSIENLAGVDYREAQFYFTSRLSNEPPAGVADTHFTPGNPRTFLGGLAVRY